MINTLEEFIEEFKKVQEMGWIKTHRAGDTGVGKTLEDLLGIEENNHDEPDFGEYELKSARLSSSSDLTLFTKAPQPRGIGKKIRMDYGYESEFDTPELHVTLAIGKTTNIVQSDSTLELVRCEDKIYIKDHDEQKVAYWSSDAVRKAFEKKYKNKFVYAFAESRGSGRNEEFRYVSAYEVSGFDFDTIINMLSEGKLRIDLRYGHYSDGKLHDHGCAYRINSANQPELFKNYRQIV